MLSGEIHEKQSQIVSRPRNNNRRIVNTNQDVKLVLSSYRPNGADARDAFFEEALEQAKRDPELMEWFVKQRVFDDVIVSKLRTIEPPAGLNLEILAGLWAIGEPRRAVGHWLAVAAALFVVMIQRILRAIEAGSPR
jgi:hypothetical protein